MLKLFIFVSALALVVFSAPSHRDDLLAAGLSAQATDGISKVTSEFFASNNPFDFGLLASQVDAYIKTQSPEDQAAFAEFSAKQKTGH